jgi:hypothetical protein
MTTNTPAVLVEDDYIAEFWDNRCAPNLSNAFFSLHAVAKLENAMRWV